MALNLFTLGKKNSPPQQNSAAPAVQVSTPLQPATNNQQPKTPSFDSQKSATSSQSIQDIIAPSAIEVDFSHIKIDDIYIRTLFVTGYPRYVSANWLSPLINFNHSLDISMFIYPSDSKDTLDSLRRRIAEMEAEINTDIERGRIPRAATEAGLEDAKVLQSQLVKGAEKFFQFSLYISISAESEKELDTSTAQIQSMLASLLIISKIASLSMEDAFKTTLPYCKDKLMLTRNMDTTALSTTFPFTSSELSDNQGILYGVNAHNDSLVIFDRFSLENANMLILATSGAGKSVSYNETVLIKNSANEVKRTKIGPLVENIIRQKGSVKLDAEMIGNINPGIKVYSFNPRTLKGEWSSVTVAAKKDAPSYLYRFATKSGRMITTTADHNMLTLNNAQIQVVKSDTIKTGDYIPLPRLIQESTSSTAKHSSLYYELIGYYTAEGCSTEYSVFISNMEQEVIDRVNYLCDKLKFRTVPLMNHNVVKGVSINSKPLIRKLKLDKCYGKAGTKKVPTTLFSQPNDSKSAFLRAYFDGDGCVEEHEVTCTTKSKQLVSDLSYLLFNFGIIARIHPKFKRTTNTNHKGDTYYQITISGQKDLSYFAQHISFNLSRKKEKLQTLLGKTTNPNDDIIPNLEQPLTEIYQYLYPGKVGAPQKLIDIKNKAFRPTISELQKLIVKIKSRLLTIKDQEKTIFELIALPQWQDLAEIGSKSKKLNKQLWKELGHTWQTMRAGTVIPSITTVLHVYQTTSGQQITKEYLFNCLYSTSKNLGFTFQDFDPTLQTTLATTKANTAYDRIYKGSQYLLKKYIEIQDNVKKANEIIHRLEVLAHSELYWDPIVKISKLKSKHPFVYDLTVNNEVFFAGFGGMFVHNSYAVKLEILRSLMFDCQVIILDPENEYEMVTKSVGGNYLSFSASASHKINPFQIARPKESTEDEMGYKYLFLMSLLKIMIGQMDPIEEATMNRALVLTYRQKGITEDPSTHTLEPPRMEDLYRSLIGMEEAVSKTLAARLERFVMGAVKGIFDQQSNIDINAPITVFTLRDTADEIRPIVMFMILDFVWNEVRKNLRKRILVVDEAWYLMRYEDSAKILQGFVKRARKYYFGVSIISQNVDDFLGSAYGKAIITNSALKLLLKQSSAAINQISETFYLSQGEKQLLLSAGVGEGIFFAGMNHVAIKIISSADEHALATSKPAEILERQKQAKLQAAAEAASQNNPQDVAKPANP